MVSREHAQKNAEVALAEQQENTFAPGFLTGPWASPALGYLVALVFQLVISIAILALIHFYPSFRFPSVPLILVILLVALGWGAGPSIVALLIGAVLLLFFVLPPIISLSIAHARRVVPRACFAR